MSKHCRSVWPISTSVVHEVGKSKATNVFMGTDMIQVRYSEQLEVLDIADRSIRWSTYAWKCAIRLFWSRIK